MASHKDGSKPASGSGDKKTAEQTKRHSGSSKKPVTIDLKAETKATSDTKPSDAKKAVEPTVSTDSKLETSHAQKPASPPKSNPPKASNARVDPKPTVASSKPAASSGSGRLIAGIVGGIIALGGLAGLMYLIGYPQSKGSVIVGANAELESRIEALENQTAPPAILSNDDKAALANSSSIAKEAAIKTKDVAERLHVAEASLAALEKSVSSGNAGENAGLASLSSKLTEVSQKLEALSTVVSEDGSGDAIDPASFEELNNKVAGIAQSIEQLSDKIAKLSDTAAGDADALAAKKWDEERAKEALETALEDIEALQEKASQPTGEDRAALAVAASGLKGEIDRGGPFESSLSTLVAVAGDSLDLSALKAFSKTGIPTLSAISNAYPPVADAILKLTQATNGSNVFQRLLSNAGTLVKLKSDTPENGNTPRAILSRLEHALDTGRLDTVLKEWETLPDAAKSASKEWIATVRSRHDADTLMQKIVASMLSRLVPAGDG